jgi:hypothetical protein
MSGAQLELLDGLPDDLPEELLHLLLAELPDELEELLDISHPLIEMTCGVSLCFVRSI